MKKFLLLAPLIFLAPLSLFAASDLDTRIANFACSGSTDSPIRITTIGDNIEVDMLDSQPITFSKKSYSGSEITSMWRSIFYNLIADRGDEGDRMEIYYTTDTIGSGRIQSTQLHMYNCENKVDKIMASIGVQKNETGHTILISPNRYIALTNNTSIEWKEPQKNRLTIFDRFKRTIRISASAMFSSGIYTDITHITEGKKAWYITINKFTGTAPNDEFLYSIDKKTKKITEL